MYSQNQEEKYILDYFGDYVGSLLSIGENDGKTLSNSLALIEKGWTADLVEPSPIAFSKLERLHKDNDKVYLWNVAIADKQGKATLHESGALLGNSDTSLVSTLIKEETKRFAKTVEYSEIEVETTTFQELSILAGNPQWDFITIDAEGYDWYILQQIDLTNVKMICVETNSIETEKYINYCKEFGMRLIYKNAENIIMAK